MTGVYHRGIMLRRTFLQGSFYAAVATQLPATRAKAFADAARAQLGVTTSYDPAYSRIPYPNGDVPRSTGVCADVVVRAGRDGLALDLQRLVHEDMVADFAAYPATWGMRHPDSNIDHRRVLNLEAYWRRAGCEVWSAPGAVAGDRFPKLLAVGDCLTWMLGARLPHIGIVVNTGSRTTILHNIGRGVEQTDLAAFSQERAKGHFRWPRS